MSTINDDDLFLVERTNTSHKVTAENLMSTIQDTDLMLVQRGTESFKVTCEDVKDQLGGGGLPVISKAELTQDQTNANRFTNNSFTTTITGKDISSLQMEATVTGALGIEGTTDAIETNGYTGSTSVPLGLKSDF